jgi:WD40 repeat protein
VKPDAPEKPNPEKPAGPQPAAGANPPPEPAAQASTWGEPVHELKGHTKHVTALAFTPDGRRALTGSEDRTMRLWDLETGQEVRRFEEGTSNFVSLAVFPDGRRAASVANTLGNGLLLWDLDTGKVIKRLEPKEKHVFFSVALAGDGKRLLAGGLDGAYLWDVQAGRELLTFKMNDLAGNSVGRLPILGVEAGMGSRAGFASAGPAVALTANGRQALVDTKRDALVHIFDTATGKQARQFGNPGRDLWASLAFSADGRLALTGSGGEMKVNGRPVPIDFGVRLWDVATGKLLQHCKGHTKTVDFLALSRDGKRALSAGQDNVAILWDLETGKELGRLTAPAGDVRGLAFSADGRQALTVTPTWSVQVWKLAGAPPNAKDAPGGKADNAPGN